MTAFNQTAQAFHKRAANIVFTLTNASGIPLDLTGAIAARWACSDIPGASPLLTKTLSGGGITVNSPGSAGVLTVGIGENELTMVPALGEDRVTLHMELEVTPAGQLAQIMAKGTLVVFMVSLP